MKEDEFQRIFPDLYKIWNEWNKDQNCALCGAWIDLMIDVKRTVMENMTNCFKAALTPTFLISKLHELGYKGTLTKEDPIYNSNVSEKPVGKHIETLKTN